MSVINVFHHSQKDYFSDIFNKLKIDKMLFFTILAIFSYGIFVLYSASNENPLTIKNQIFRIVISIIAFFIATKINIIFIRNIAFKFFLITSFLLLFVELLGHTAMGATRWIDLYFFKFQPSELMKLSMPIMVSWLIFKFGEPDNFKKVLFYSMFIVIPCLLILRQPDLGTAILIFMSAFFTLFTAGLPFKIIISSTVSVILFTPIIWNFILKEYQKDRIMTLFNPENDPLGNGYHIIQSKTAIGNGGFSGTGWLNGTQTHLSFIPEQKTDFIFATLAEEYGLIGVSILLLLYALLISRCFFIAYTLKNPFTKLIITSYTMLFLVYVFVNIGMVSGILPVVGVPLPLISYGGTSMLTIMFSFGLISSFYIEEKKLK